MIKQIKRRWFGVAAILFFMMPHMALAAGGFLFNVIATGKAANVNITLCLNAKGPYSCQTYNVSALNLSITTTIPNHVYPYAGIKINTPGFTLAPGYCTPLANGYCMFSVSDVAAKTIVINTQRYAYVPNFQGSSISICLINGVTGFLSGCTNTSISFPSMIALNSAGTIAYVTQGGRVSLCAVDSKTGALSACQTTFNGLVTIRFIALNAAGTFAYVADDAVVFLCRVNQTNGALSDCVSTGSGFGSLISGIALNPAQTIAYVSSTNPSKVVRCDINPVSGALTGCVDAASVFSSPIYSITLNPAGTFAYITIISPGGIYLCAVNGTNGDLENCTTTAVGVYRESGYISINASNTLAYVKSSDFIDPSLDIVYICSVNANDGTLSGCVDSGGTGFDFPVGVTLG
jgi:hypothetical protein